MAKEYKWCSIDAEGDVGNKGLLGVAFYSDRVQEYIIHPPYIRRMLEIHAELGYTFIAHNAQYDLSVIFWQLGIPMTAIYYAGRFNRGEWRYDKTKPCCQLWDTAALSGFLSLEKLGTALNIPKYPTPQKLLGKDPNKYEWQCELHGTWECEPCYAVRDAEIAYRFVVDLETTLTGWGVRPHRRISGLAMNVWKVMDEPEPIAITNHAIKQLGRKAYHGGRVECFKLGRVSPVYTADVCSMYPSVMLDTPYPSPNHMHHMKDVHPSMVPLDCEGVATVDITVPQMYVPPLAYIHRGLLTYPCGRFLCHATIREIRYALSLGCRVNRWIEVAWASENVLPFQRFVSTLWAMREAYETTNDSRSLFAKLLMNNLYGRIGMKDVTARKDVIYAEPGTNYDMEKHTGWYTQSNKLYLEAENDLRTRNQWSNVLWAAQTTAEARIRLHRYLLAQGNALLYCDTDSVFSLSPISTEKRSLGALTSPETYGYGILSAPKLYALFEGPTAMRAKAKGVRPSMALQFLREGTVSYQQPVRPSSQRSRQVEAGTWVDITRTNNHLPPRRQPLSPEVLESGDSWSDTRAPWVGPYS